MVFPVTHFVTLNKKPLDFQGVNCYFCGPDGYNYLNHSELNVKLYVSSIYKMTKSKSKRIIVV